MRVLFVNLVYGSGSTGKIIADIMRQLNEAGDDVKVLYGTGERGQSLNSVRISGKLGYYFHNGMSRITDHAGLYSYHATRKLIHEVEIFEPDIIHLHTLHGFYVNYEMLFRFLKGADIPVVWTLHDCWAFTGHCTHFSQANCYQWQTHCLECRLLFRYPQCYFKGDVSKNYSRKKAAFNGVKGMTITVPSKWLAEQVSHSFLSSYPLEVISNGVDRSIFFPQGNNIRGKYHLEKKKIILGVANAWNERKGLLDMLTLAKRLDQTYQVVLIGLVEQQLNNLSEGVIGITRTSNQHELAQWYSAADVFVNPTYEETFGMTTIEAQACGAPVVVYNTGGCPETVAPGNGTLVEQGDLDALEEAVRCTVEAGKRANPHMMDKYDINKVYKQYLYLYKRKYKEKSNRDYEVQDDT